jgi:Flp pilus assembly protein CpaB
LKGVASAPAAGATARVLIFSRNVDALAPLNSADLAWADWPQAALTEGMVRGKPGSPLPAFDAIPAPLGFSRGDPVPRRLIEANGERSQIRPGMRAVAVRLRDDNTASLIAPGMSADVIFSGGRGGAQGPAATLRGVRVLSIRAGHKSAGQRRGGEIVALLELSPRQAEIAARSALAGEAAVAIAGAADEAADGVRAPARPIVLVKNGAFAKAEAAGPFE